MQVQESENKSNAAEALALLEQAWAYYMPEPTETAELREPELFEYANAA
ncbi:MULTISPECIES: hypothetical protein [Ruegeria]|jgi:hypothetical protein|nr:MULTISPECIES: hypothetical protein [Ruegeria]MBO9411535.1 hypothetical protein [Ruegeria sp. R8_1]MBO9415903.1 hypothetical protein [Ruegeria sp. R8_2]